MEARGKVLAYYFTLPYFLSPYNRKQRNLLLDYYLTSRLSILTYYGCLLSCLVVMRMLLLASYQYMYFHSSQCPGSKKFLTFVNFDILWLFAVMSCDNENAITCILSMCVLSLKSMSGLKKNSLASCYRGPKK